MGLTEGYRHAVRIIRLPSNPVSQLWISDHLKRPIPAMQCGNFPTDSELLGRESAEPIAEINLVQMEKLRLEIGNLIKSSHFERN